MAFPNNDQAEPTVARNFGLKQALPAAPGHRRVRPRGALGPTPAITPHHQTAKPILREQACLPPTANQNAQSRPHPFFPATSQETWSSVLLSVGFGKKQHNPQTKSRRRLPTNRQKRSLGRRTTKLTCPARVGDLRTPKNQHRGPVRCRARFGGPLLRGTAPNPTPRRTAAGTP